IVLHPRHKLSYFKNVNWEESWIDTTKKLVKDVFKRLYTTEETDNQDGLGEDTPKLKEVHNWLLTIACALTNAYIICRTISSTPWLPWPHPNPLTY
ncbi:hypothetical protein PAXRUDRAFT_140660, partial [Paxillus rubicundulus Ve08.2h10]